MKGKDKLKQVFFSILTFCIVLTNYVPVFADKTPYQTFIPIAGSSSFGYAQDLYEPVALYAVHTESPEDIWIYGGNLYVADSRLSAIIILSRQGEYLGSIGEGVLAEPTGVFVDKDYIYVADYGQNLVFKFNHQNELVAEYGRPDSPLYGRNERYRPVKIAADAAQNMYIISEGGTNGIIQMNDLGEFLGYFGVNTSNVTLKMVLQRMIFTQAQRDQLLTVKPPSPNNIAIDSDGLVYSVTKDAATPSERLKKLNIAGKNVLDIDFAENDMSDLTVDADGNIYYISPSSSFISSATPTVSFGMYDNTGNFIGVIFIDDASQERMGVFRQPTAIAVDDDRRLYVADKDKGAITVLAPTEMTSLILQGLNYYKEGHYIQSMDIWNEVLMLNSNVSMAHNSLGRAYFKQRNYSAALQSFMLSADKDGYSNAYWEERNVWLHKNLGYFFTAFIILYLIKFILSKVDKRTGLYNPVRELGRKYRGTRFYREIKPAFYVLKNPVDMVDYVKRLKKVSYIGFFILLAVFVVVQISSAYFKGYLFTGFYREAIPIFDILVMLIVPLFTFIVANYMVSTITEGEGSFKNVAIVTVSALSPLYLFGLPLSLLTNVLTLNEAFVFSFGTFFITAWSAINLFVVIKELHDFSFWGAIKNVLLTLFGMIIILLVIFIVYVLADQVIQFVIHFR